MKISLNFLRDDQRCEKETERRTGNRYNSLVGGFPFSPKKLDLIDMVQRRMRNDTRLRNETTKVERVGAWFSDDDEALLISKVIR